MHDVVDAVGARIANWELVDEDPLVNDVDVCNDGHAGAGDVLVVGDVTHDWSHVFRSLNASGTDFGRALGCIGPSRSTQLAVKDLENTRVSLPTLL